MRQLKSLAFVLLVILGTPGCASTSDKTIYLRPVCTPALLESEPPTVDAGQLYDRIGEDAYWALVTREKMFVDWAAKNIAILESICEKPQAWSEGTYES